MTTLIAVYNFRRCVGRCDARCYEAKSDAKTCDCICGGKNHGAGKKQATANVHSKVGLTYADLDYFASMHSLEIPDLIVVNRLTVPNQRAALRKARRDLVEPELPLERRS